MLLVINRSPMSKSRRSASFTYKHAGHIIRFFVVCRVPLTRYDDINNLAGDSGLPDPGGWTRLSSPHRHCEGQRLGTVELLTIPGLTPRISHLTIFLTLHLTQDGWVTCSQTKEAEAPAGPPRPAPAGPAGREHHLLRAPGNNDSCQQQPERRQGCSNTWNRSKRWAELPWRLRWSLTAKQFPTLLQVPHATLRKKKLAPTTMGSSRPH